MTGSMPCGHLTTPANLSLGDDVGQRDHVPPVHCRQCLRDRTGLNDLSLWWAGVHHGLIGLPVPDLAAMYEMPEPVIRDILACEGVTATDEPSCGITWTAEAL